MKKITKKIIVVLWNIYTTPIQIFYLLFLFNQLNDTLEKIEEKTNINLEEIKLFERFVYIRNSNEVKELFTKNFGEPLYMAIPQTLLYIIIFW